MFPIRWNFPFRKKDGSMSTIGGEIENAGGSYTLPTASAETKGGVKIGSGLTMTGEVLSNNNPTPYSLPTASSETLGGVKVGSGLSIDDGVLSNSNPTPYSLPTASAETLGGVKIGSGITIDENGAISASGGSTPTVDTITLDSETASGTLKMVKGDDGFIKVAGVIDLVSALSSDRVKIATGIAEKYRPGSTNTNWINLKAYVYNSSFSTMYECHAEIFGNGNVWVYYPDGVSSFSAYHVYITGIYRNDVYNGASA